MLLLLIAVGFNLWTYRSEPSSQVDPNDNTFQFALVDRTNQIWSFAQQKCTGISKPFCVISYLSDHWVPNWAEGYNLPYYYSHVPQILIVASWRLISPLIPQYTLFTHYHWVIYLLLSLFPISLYIALRVVGIPWISAGIGALFASQISTDGLYGLDPASFLWRGYGLSSQLFAAISLPLALAYAWRYLHNDTSPRSLWPAIASLAATTAGHLGMGIIGFMSMGILAISPSAQALLTQSWDRQATKHLISTFYKLCFVFGGVGLLLGYWIVPILRDGNYHNISVWDGIWKFDSFGYREVLKNLFNGDLFDFGRLPVMTIAVCIGLFAAFSGAYFGFSLLFIFWLLLYFGRTTWGGLFSLIPGMSEYHLSRFIVGVHMAGAFLIPLGIEKIRDILRQYAPKYVPATVRPLMDLVSMGIIITLGIALVYPQTIRYAKHNDVLIARGIDSYRQDIKDIDGLVTALRSKIADKPGRVFAGRGGSWGKGFRIAETPMYMHLSTYGIPVVLWLPETWSPNSDTEQYFSENNPAHYNLYNVRYVATPASLPPEQIQPFWSLVESGDKWKLYEVATDGYIVAGIRPAIVSSTKADYRNVVRLWMHSDAIEQGLFPELTFDAGYPKQTGRANFRMKNEVTYETPDTALHNLFSEAPLYLPPAAASLQQFAGMKKEDYVKSVVTSQSENGDMVFTARATVKENCKECIVILKQSFHPSWRATVDGKPQQTFAVFPFYTAVSLDTPGDHDIVFSYAPSAFKRLFLAVGLMSLLCLFWIARKTRTNH